MIRVRQIKVGIKNDTDDYIISRCAKKLGVLKEDIISFTISKKSIDARDKSNINFVYELDVCLRDEKVVRFNRDVLVTPNLDYVFPRLEHKFSLNRPVIVGSGPAGLFCAYLLAENGYKPLIIERGEMIEDRVKTVSEFWKSGKLNTNSNVCFGEGGAGTFSDGKLNTLVRDKANRMRKVFETFVSNGAPEEILYLNKPHIGTDLLRNVVINMRRKIISMGGEFRYNCTLTDTYIVSNKVCGIEVNGNEKIACDILVLAIGHSARDTFKMLYDKGLEMQSKPFAVGVRVQHPQSLINFSQYGSNDLGSASYKLTYNNDRGIYSFCMCPGGFVVNASSENDGLVINGMSNHDRSSENANSAIVVSVTPDDFGSDVFAGVRFQRELERKAFVYGKGKIPVQLYGDFLENKVSTSFGKVKPIFKGEYSFSNINDILPKYICDNLKEGINYFDSKIKGFADSDMIIAGVETRTSSPIRILRDEKFVSNISGIYPCGEGAGYAGGITTSAMDGIKVAEAIALEIADK